MGVAGFNFGFNFGFGFGFGFFLCLCLCLSLSHMCAHEYAWIHEYTLSSLLFIWYHIIKYSVIGNKEIEIEIRMEIETETETEIWEWRWGILFLVCVATVDVAEFGLAFGVLE